MVKSLILRKYFFPHSIGRTDLDWDTVNKLAEENADFRDFILRVRNDLSSKEVRKEKYDRVLNAEELVVKIKA